MRSIIMSYHKTEMDEIAVILKRFGDEQSTLMDQFERLSFEVQLNQTILGRSLSEPGKGRARRRNGRSLPPPSASEVKQGRRLKLGFNKVLKKLMKPFIGRLGKAGGAAKSEAPDPKDPKYWKAFSRSLRF